MAKTKARGAVLTVAAGTPHPDFKDIDDIDHGNLKGAAVVLMTTSQARDVALATLRQAGAATVVPVAAGDSDAAEAALAHLRTTAGSRAGPSMSLIRAARSCAATIPEDTFGEMGPAIDQMARLSGAPAEFVAGWVLSTASALISGRFRVYVRPEFEVAPIIWTASVGDASTNKSPAGSIVLKPIHAIEREFRRHHDLDAKNAAAAGGKADVPPARRVLVANASIEALQHIVAGERRAMLAGYDELSDWFNSLRRYSKSATGDRGSWLAAHNGFPLTIDRRNLKEPLRIDHWGVALAGGIPPSVLASLVDSAELESGDGLDVRLFYFMPPPPPIVARPNDGDEAGTVLWAKVVERLFVWRNQAAPEAALKFTPAAREKFESWRVDLLNSARRLGDVDAWTGKLPGAVARVCGVLAALDAAVAGRDEPKQIDVTVLTRAAAFIDVVSRHRQKVQLARGVGSTERLTAELAGYILRYKVLALDTFEARRGVVPGIRTDRALRQVLNELDAAGWLEEAIPLRRDEPLPPIVHIRKAVFEVTHG